MRKRRLAAWCLGLTASLGCVSDDTGGETEGKAETGTGTGTSTGIGPGTETGPGVETETGDETTGDETTGDATTGDETETGGDCEENPDDPECGCMPGEMLPCYSGPPNTEGVGECVGGVSVCDADTLEFGECADEVVPAAEDCDSPEDESCDGLATCDPPQPPDLDLSLAPVKRFELSWAPAIGAQYYRVFEREDPDAEFVQVGADTLATSAALRVPLHMRTSASYRVQACNSFGCTDSQTVDVTGALVEAIGYFKASNTGGNDHFGWSVRLSADGGTLVVGASEEDSAGDRRDDSAEDAGAVYVFVRDEQDAWTQQAYLKAANAGAGDKFGYAIALSSEGDTLAVGAHGVAEEAGAVYVFERDDQGAWTQAAQLEASNPDAGDFFGFGVALSGDADTLAVGARLEDSAGTGVDADQADDSAANAGAVYVFARTQGDAWVQQAYLKAANAQADDSFGNAVALSTDGDTLAIGAYREDGGAAGVDADALDNSAVNAGAAYVFERDEQDQWSQQVYLKASNPDLVDIFGVSVALSADGDTLAIGAEREDSAATGVGGDQGDGPSEDSGAVYMFERDGDAVWTQAAYVKASNTGFEDHFGWRVTLSADGQTLAVGARLENGGAVGLNGPEGDAIEHTGAVYFFDRDEQDAWAQRAYIKASNTHGYSYFGNSVALSADGTTLAVGAYQENSSATGIGGDQDDESAFRAGAVYLY